MSTQPAACSLRRFAVDTLPREPWKNSGGWTRTIASQEALGQLRWRVSVADIAAAGPFSRFDGMERTAVMIRGTELCLNSETDAWHFDGLGSVAQFSGERMLQCSKPGVPTQLWNVMVRRGQAEAHLRIVEDQTVDLPLAPDVLVLVLRGCFELTMHRAETQTFAAGEGLHLQGRVAPERLAPCEAKSLLLITALR